MAQGITKQALPKTVLIIFFSTLSAAGPLCTDMFLPAMPDMPAQLGTTEAMVSQCVTMFFLTQSIGMLLFGPFSDRFGRKKPLLIAICIAAGGGLAASVSPNIEFLLAMRALQGLGGGGMVSIATALVKDCFEGETRQRVLVAVQAILCIAPIVAPLLGSAVLMFTDWRGCFVAMAAVSALCIPLTLTLREPLAPEDRTTGNPLLSLGGLVKVARNDLFVKMLLVTAAGGISIMAYITSASYVYMEYFGLDRLGYSLFFGANAFITIIGTVLIPKIVERTSTKKASEIFFILLPISGVLFLLLAGLSPWTFLATVAIQNTLGCMVRPIAMDLMLNMQEHDTGSASALMNFGISILGCVGSVAIAGPWPSYIIGIGGMGVFFTGIGLIGWLIIRNRIPE